MASPDHPQDAEPARWRPGRGFGTSFLRLPGLSRAGSHAPLVTLVCGVGSGNTGNDVSFETARALFAQHVPELRFRLVTPSPATAGERGIEVLPMRLDYREYRSGSRGRTALRLISAEAERIPRMLGWIRGSRLIVVTGTGIFDDFGELPRHMPLALAEWAGLARILRVPFVFMSVGAGPIRNPVSRSLMAGAARTAAGISYRDEDSRRFMVETAGVDGRVVPDLAFAATVAAGRAADPAAAGATVGVGVMAYGGWSVDSEGAVYEAYVARLVEIVSGLLDRGLRVRFIVGQPIDLPVVDDVIVRCVAAHPAWAHELTRPTGMETFAGVYDAIVGTDLVVVTRYHNLVAALMAARPAVSLSYGPKNGELLRMAGLQHLDRPLENADSAWVLDRVDDIRAGREALPDDWSATTAAWARQVRDEAAHVLELAGLGIEPRRA